MTQTTIKEKLGPEQQMSNDKYSFCIKRIRHRKLKFLGRWYVGSNHSQPRNYQC